MLIFPEPRDLTNLTAHAVDLTWQRMWCGDKGFPDKMHGKVTISFLQDALESMEQVFFVFSLRRCPKGAVRRAKTQGSVEGGNQVEYRV